MKKSLQNLITEYPLYKSFIGDDKYYQSEESYTDPFSFQGETFHSYCEEENHRTTFEIQLPIIDYKYWAELPGGDIPEQVYDNSGKINFTQHFIGQCQSCKKFKIDLIFRVWSDVEIPRQTGQIFRGNLDSKEFQLIDETKENHPKIFIEKIGIFPPNQIHLDKSIKKYFDRETENLYFKALKSYNENLGIASFAYFRRIIEKELINILNDIAELEASNPKLKKMISEYKNTKKAYSIYENIFEFLPVSLKSLGENPLKLLYQQTSEGLHSISDKKCLERAENINMILKFVIKKIQEETSEILDIRNAIKNLGK